MAWLDHHKNSEQLAAEAEVLARSGDWDPARRFYAEAAAAEGACPRFPGWRQVADIWHNGRECCFALLQVSTVGRCPVPGSSLLGCQTFAGLRFAAVGRPARLHTVGKG